MLKLGIVQMSVLEGKVDENCSKIRKAVESHAAGDIDLLCFPELCISGYVFESAVLSDGEAAFFSELAAEYEIAILAGIHMPREINIMIRPASGTKRENFWQNTGRSTSGIRKMIFLKRGTNLLQCLQGLEYRYADLCRSGVPGGLHAAGAEGRCGCHNISERMGRWVGRFIYHVQQDEGCGESGIHSFFEQGIGRCTVLRQFYRVQSGREHAYAALHYG